LRLYATVKAFLVLLYQLLPMVISLAVGMYVSKKFEYLNVFEKFIDNTYINNNKTKEVLDILINKLTNN